MGSFFRTIFVGKRVSVVPDPRGFPVRKTVNPANEQGRPVTGVFGYHVSDEHTFPTYLSTVLNERARAAALATHVEVTNYGRGFYYPSQETVLLLDLLRLGHRPKLVIFMDGVNLGTTQDVPQLYAEYVRRFRRVQSDESNRLTKVFR
jgi:hypothetical protein